MSVSETIDLADIEGLVARVTSGGLRLDALVEEVQDRVARSSRPEAWLSLVDAETLERRIGDLEARRARGEAMPLLGVPFAIKDNIDLAGLPTTAGCPAFASVPDASAACVLQLEQAGAIAIGKTHMDQFATGLVGTRSPHGPCRNAHDAAFIAGGSSSGSAVVVAQELVSFALGTDTAGSGRVPAALNGIVGLKPTRGRLSLRGVLPACASLDCVSVFARSALAARTVLEAFGSSDPADPTMRAALPAAPLGASFTFGVPPRDEWASLCGDDEEAFLGAIEALRAVGGQPVDVSFRPFGEVAELLYGGPWVAERLCAVGDFVRDHPEAVDPSVASLLRQAETLSARQAFEGFHRLEALRRDAAVALEGITFLMVPTVPTAWRIDEVMADPIGTNAALGRTNNFMNLLDLAGVVIPIGVGRRRIPFGITCCGPAWSESRLLEVAARVQSVHPSPSCPSTTPPRIPLAVVGAHLRGMPLNRELLELGGRFGFATRTAPAYRLHALAGTVPPKPGLERDPTGGAAIEAEVWWLPPEGFGRFVAGVPAPLAIGTLELEDGREVPGFVCEPIGLQGAEDATSFGGWRGYVASRRDG